MWIINSCDSCFCRSAAVQGATTAIVPILSGAVASLECNIYFAACLGALVLR